MPQLEQALYKLVECFLLCESQLIVGYSTIYGLDYNVVIKVAKDLNIETNETFYKLLRSYENVLIRERNEDIKRASKYHKSNNRG